MIEDINENVIRHLNYLCRTYDGVIKLITATKNRVHALTKDADPKHQDEIKLMESLTGKIGRKIMKELAFFPVWTEWLVNVLGIGPAIGGHLILLYYFRFIPICATCGGGMEKQPTENGDRNQFVCVECGKRAKGDGVLTHKIEYKDFRNPSSWWHYMGRHVVNGKVPKRAKGVTCDWSSKGRAIGYMISDQFNRQKEKTPYGRFLLDEREKIAKKYPALSKGHNLNRARNHVAKLFLSHFWQVARTLDGKPLTEPYVKTFMGHSGIIEPFHFEPPVA